MTELSTITEVRRDRWGRPIIKAPDGSETGYTRVTTFVGAFESEYNLTAWKMRQVAIGLTLRKDLALAAAAHADDKKTLNKVCEDAMDAAAAAAPATTGTAMHAVTENHDRGKEPHGGLPSEALTDLAAYAAATADLKAIYIEQLTVNDELKVAGTPDRVVEYQGRRYIADLKTGGIDFGAGKIAAQLAVYANSQNYSHETGERIPHGADLDRGIVIHLPAGSGECKLHWVDLRAGWDIAKVCGEVRRVRNFSARQLYTEFGKTSDVTIHQALASPTGVTTASIATRIEAAQSRAELNDLWESTGGIWTDVEKQMASSRAQALAS